MTTLTFPFFGFFDVDISVKRRAAMSLAAPTELETARAALLDQIEHGFKIEGSDTRADVPGFAKTHLKTLVEMDC